MVIRPLTYNPEVQFTLGWSLILWVGPNALANRLANINGKINLKWLNLSYETLKIKCKELFIIKTQN